MLAPEPIDLAYEADLLGNIQQALAGLQGFDVMALELIQNADDAGATILAFDVRDNALVVRNDGRFSTCGLGALRCPWEQGSGPDGLLRPCNFHAISRMGGRSKVHASGQIGRFGIGFVSVYQITDTPIIRSAGIEMKLEPLRGVAPTTSVADAGGTEFELPWAATSSPTRQALNASPTPNDVASLLRSAISSVMARGLLFLRHLKRVELHENGRLERSVTIRREGGLVTLEVTPDSRLEHWKVLTRDAADLAEERGIFTDYPTLAQLDRSSTVHVAIPLSDEPPAGLLYAYLPTEQRSGMPLHVNGDFFPHPNRRSIVLSGEQHERYWNELLLDTAARAIGEAFEELRNLLGGLRLWTLGNAAFALRETKGFSEFWVVFSTAAKASPSVWTVGEKWWKPGECYLAPEQIGGAEQAALANLGLKLLHQDLRPLWTVLSSVGVAQLKLSNIVEALHARGDSPDISFNDPHLLSLWSAINVMIEASRSTKGVDEVLKRLKAATFLLDTDGEPGSIDGLWRSPVGVRAEEIKVYIADCPLVHGEAVRHAAIMDAIDLYGFDNLADDLANTITDSFVAATIIGTDGNAARRFYDLLTAFEIDEETTRAGEILADVPILWSLSGFVSPSRGQLPGGFVDPSGHLALVDRTSMSERMHQLALSVLGVPVLTFKEYVEEHLAEILAAGPTREQYAALLREIVEHRAELDADDGLEPLADHAFVRTRAGGYARPNDCYYWSAALAALLGDDGDRWVDDEWMPAGRPGSRLRDLFENRLGMRFTVATRHIVDRIAKIAESDTIDDLAARATPIVRHILERFARFGPDDRRELERLRSVAFLPGATGGERVLGRRYTPAQVYRAFRSSGFASQVPVVDLPPLRGGGSSLIEFLDLIGMPADPPTDKIVAHLEHCMAAGSPAPDAIYAILYERLDALDAACIDRLAGTDFIYDGEFERYLPADKVFWIPPPFGRRWHAASSRMRQREALYRRLGVIDEPGAANYSALLKEIASLKQPTSDDVAVHSRCLAWLADALDRGLGQAREAIEGLVDEYSLLNLRGEPVWTDDAAWVDSTWLAAPFGDVLDERLVEPPEIHRAAAARLLKKMGVVPLSQIARLRLASIPIERPAPGATDRLRERADLLLWLAPGQEFRKVLRGILARIDVRLTINLEVHAEIIEFDPPVRSPVSLAAAFYDSDSAILYIRAAEGEPTDWSAAFRALFAQLESYAFGIDLPPVIMTAAFVTSLPTWAEAEQSLRHSDYRPPAESGDLPPGERLGDTPDDPVDEEEAPTGHARADEQKEPARNGADEHIGTELGGADQGDEDVEEESKGLENGNDTSGNSAAEDAGASKLHPEGAVGGTAIDKDDPFKSKAASATFGVEPNANSPQEAVGGGTDGLPGAAGSSRNDGESRRLETSAERHVRRSRMLAYVNTIGDPTDPARRIGDDANISELVDIAAITAVLKYERARGWFPEEQPHGNPGYDIISRTPDGNSRRLIEVKGLESEWTERGIKLTHVQYRMAETYPDEFWIYVVEHARDLEHQRVSAIANPFSKVEEYWFDHRWKDTLEESATAQDINIRIGARVSHSLWKIGEIVAMERRGIAWMLTIDFGPIEGRRYIPYSSNLKFVD